MIMAAGAAVDAGRVVVHHLGLRAGVLNRQEDGTARRGVNRPVIVVLVVLHIALGVLVPAERDLKNLAVPLIAVDLFHPSFPFLPRPARAERRAGKKCGDNQHAGNSPQAFLLLPCPDALFHRRDAGLSCHHRRLLLLSRWGFPLVPAAVRP